MQFKDVTWGAKIPGGWLCYHSPECCGAWGDLSFMFSLLSAQGFAAELLPSPSPPSFTPAWGHPVQAWALGTHSEPCTEPHSAPAGLTQEPFSTQQINVIKVFIAYCLKPDQVFYVSDDSFSQHYVMW